MPWHVDIERQPTQGAKSNRNGQLHAQGFADPRNRVQPGLCVWTQGFVKRLAFDAGGFGNFRHAPRLGDVPKRSSLLWTVAIDIKKK